MKILSLSTVNLAVFNNQCNQQYPNNPNSSAQILEEKEELNIEAQQSLRSESS